MKPFGMSPLQTLSASGVDSIKVCQATVRKRVAASKIYLSGQAG